MAKKEPSWIEAPKQMLRLKDRAARFERLAAVDRARAASAERHADLTQKLLERVSIENVTAAGGLSAVSRELQHAQDRIDDLEHELEKVRAVSDGFRARAEKAEADLARGRTE